MKEYITRLRDFIHKKIPFTRSKSWKNINIVLGIILAILAMVYINTHPLVLPDWMPQIKPQESITTQTTQAGAEATTNRTDAKKATATDKEPTEAEQNQVNPLFTRIIELLNNPCIVTLQYRDTSYYCIQDIFGNVYLSVASQGETHEYAVTSNGFLAKYDNEWNSIRQGDLLLDYLSDYEDAINTIQDTFYYMSDDQLKGSYTYESVPCQYSIQEYGGGAMIINKSDDQYLNYQLFIKESTGFIVEEIINEEN